MTDRELLELAAKASRTPIWTDIDGTVFTDDPTGIEVEWNPLTDDGDALRLAVKLEIAPIQEKKEKVCAAYWTDIHCVHVAYKGDPYAATRRAIVRAAAEIGKAM